MLLMQWYSYDYMTSCDNNFWCALIAVQLCNLVQLDCFLVCQLSCLNEMQLSFVTLLRCVFSYYHLPDFKAPDCSGRNPHCWG